MGEKFQYRSQMLKKFEGGVCFASADHQPPKKNSPNFSGIGNGLDEVSLFAHPERNTDRMI